MAHKRRYQDKRRASRTITPAPTVVHERPAAIPRKARTQYGKPIILLEDGNKDTFEFQGGRWVAHAMTIAEARESCFVKELPQKVNGMTRYEIRYPITEET
jgi:hypothetical protein